HCAVMTEPLWQASPSVPLLQWLARGPLKQNLLQGIRLWVWLHLLYGAAGQDLGLTDPFTYADWRDRFFSATHPTGEKKPQHADARCPCNKCAAAWLFAPTLNFTQAAWQSYAEQHSAEVQTQIAAFSQALQAHDQHPEQLERLLNTPLFGMTRRTLYGDLRNLTSISWLTQRGQSFHRVTDWPDVPQQNLTPAMGTAPESSFITQPDLAAIAENLSREMGGDRRFFVHVDYVVPQHKLDRVDDWQALLSELWQQHPIPPVQLLYQGAGYTEPVSVVVYPVCIYYFRRGPYLCAFGAVPQTSSRQLDWRNYRLDRLLNIKPLPWTHSTVPPPLRQQHTKHSLPQPDDIASRMEAAWGFDYYQPAQRLLLRFDQAWDERYIRNSMRHATFNHVPFAQVQSLIRQQLQGAEQQQLLEVLKQRSPTDAYYTAMYREHDPNVHQRLRAWRPHVEILLPWDLRQRMINEVRQEWQIYGLS
ncbi:MAG: TIGR03985 family CRISPR-associated protein, partial [Cyanobacteria bacterium P01_D01_bin.6]